MKIRRLAAGLVLLVACSSTTALDSHDSLVVVDGSLRFVVSDAPAVPGVLFISANASGGAGKVTITSTRYGSVCGQSVTSHADVSGHSIVLHVTYAERAGAVCTADVRALTYRAEIGLLSAGEYDVQVVHANAPDSIGNTVYMSRVTVT